VPPRHPWAVVGFACFLGAAAVAGVTLAALGETLPPPGPVLLLALVVALCINRFAFFSSEIAATAEVAVLTAAVVAFRDDAWVLGPLAVALLVGPLDTLHWERRSFLRMAYNAGNRATATFAAVVTFALVREGAHGSATMLFVAATAAAIVFALVDSSITVTLLWIQGEPAIRAAAVHVLELDSLTVPLALYGATAGVLATEVGWWAAVPVLVPVAFIPELALGRRGWRGVAIRNVAMSAVIVMLAVAIVVSLPSSDAAIAVLVVLAAAMGGELAVDTRAPVPPLLALVVTAAVVLLRGELVFVAAVLVAVVGTLSAWMVKAARARPPVATALSAAGLAAVASAVGAGVYHLIRPGLGPPTEALPAACAAGAVFELSVVLVGQHHGRFRVLSDLVWLSPTLAVAAAVALAWRLAGVRGWAAPAGAVLAAMAVAGVLGVAAWWCAPPWRSRVLARWVADRSRRGHGALVVTSAATAVLLASVGAITTHDTHLALVLGAVTSGEAVVVMALAGVRQWRFAPRRRLRELLLLVAAGLVLAVAYPGSATSGNGWAVVMVAVPMITALACALPLARYASGGGPAAAGRLARTGPDPVMAEPPQWR
jgi:hypothetical protein